VPHPFIYSQNSLPPRDLDFILISEPSLKEDTGASWTLIMHRLTLRVVKQLSSLHSPFEKTHQIKGIERSHIAGAFVVTALVETTFKIVAGLLLDGLHVISRDQIISSETAEEDPERIHWNHEH
jgi:hypothetical protein